MQDNSCTYKISRGSGQTSKFKRRDENNTLRACVGMTITGLCATWQRGRKNTTCTYDQVREHLDSETQKTASWETNPCVRETCFFMRDLFSHNVSQVSSIKLEMVVRKNSWLKDHPTETPPTHTLFKIPFSKTFPLHSSTLTMDHFSKNIPIYISTTDDSPPVVRQPFANHFPSNFLPSQGPHLF